MSLIDAITAVEHGRHHPPTQASYICGFVCDSQRERKIDCSLTQGGRGGGGVWNLARLRQGAERRTCSRAGRFSESSLEFLEPTGWCSLPLNRSRGSLSHRANRLDPGKTSSLKKCSPIQRKRGKSGFFFFKKVEIKLGPLVSSSTASPEGYLIKEPPAHMVKGISIRNRKVLPTNTCCFLQNMPNAYSHSPHLSYSYMSKFLAYFRHYVTFSDSERLVRIFHTCVGMSLWMCLRLAQPPYVWIHSFHRPLCVSVAGQNV